MIHYIRKFQYSKPLQILLIILFCLIIYGPSLGNGFIWDDDFYVYKNPLIHRLDGLNAIWFTHKTAQYYPFVFTTFWLEHKLWGLNPFGYHAVNLILHVLNALLVFWVVQKLCKPLAFWVALLFTIHPIQVETVAWITERKNLLSLFFFLLAILSYLRFDRTQKPRDYLITLIIFVCALFSKSIAVCFVFVPLLYKWWRDGKFTWREFRLSIPFACIGIFSAVNTIYLELHHVGAKGNEWGMPFLERFALSGRILLFYIYKLCIPFKFMFIYPRWAINITEWRQWSFLLVSISLLFVLFLIRNRIGRGAFVLFLFYLASIFPALGFINVYPMRFSFVADHFSYLSTPALLLLICASVYFLFNKLCLRFPFLMRAIVSTLFVIIVIFMSGESMALTKNYKDAVTLWKDVILKNPTAWIAYNNLGFVYQGIGKDEEAIMLFKKSIELNPENSEAYNNLGETYRKIGKYNKAVALYNQAIAVDPECAAYYNNLGLVYSSIAQKEKAILLYKKALTLNPRLAETYYNLGDVYKDLGKNEEAVALYKKALTLNPQLAIAYYNLAVIYFYKEQYNIAIKYCDKAIELGYKVNADFLKLLEPYR